MAVKRKKYTKMVCDACKNINHSLHKSKVMPEKFSESMYCKHCKKHTKHKETKK